MLHLLTLVRKPYNFYNVLHILQLVANVTNCYDPCCFGLNLGVGLKVWYDCYILLHFLTCSDPYKVGCGQLQPTPALYDCYISLHVATRTRLANLHSG